MPTSQPPTGNSPAFQPLHFVYLSQQIPPPTAGSAGAAAGDGEDEFEHGVRQPMRHLVNPMLCKPDQSHMYIYHHYNLDI